MVYRLPSAVCRLSLPAQRRPMSIVHHCPPSTVPIVHGRWKAPSGVPPRSPCFVLLITRPHAESVRPSRGARHGPGSRGEPSSLSPRPAPLGPARLLDRLGRMGGNKGDDPSLTLVVHGPQSARAGPLTARETRDSR